MKDLILVATVGILLVVGWLVFSSSPQGHGRQNADPARYTGALTSAARRFRRVPSSGPAPLSKSPRREATMALDTVGPKRPSRDPERSLSVEPRKQETMREWWAKQTPREKVEFAVAMAIWGRPRDPDGPVHLRQHVRKPARLWPARRLEKEPVGPSARRRSWAGPA
jgi:hypothetical protein